MHESVGPVDVSKKTPPWVARKKAGPQRGKFTRALWDKWMAELNGVHPHAAQLREGITEMRGKLTTTRDSMRSTELIRSYGRGYD